MSKFNTSNPAVKRIMREIKEIHENSSHDFIAEALEDDIFEWHFVIRGPPDSEFEGGIYHGRILLPAEYPFKPPSFMMLSPSGRFQTNSKICLSISSHHPEHWQPSWSVRTALTAMIAFMPTPGQGALGSLEFPKDERKKIALKSRSDIPKFGNAARQELINEMHQRMLRIQASSSTAEAARGDTISDSVSTATAPPGTLDSRHAAAARTPAAQQEPEQPAAATAGSQVQPRAVATTGTSDTSLNLLALVLTMAILAILMKKLIFAWSPESMEF